MLCRISLDPNTGAEVHVRGGRGRVASIEGVGPSIGDRWAYYLVDLTDITGHEMCGSAWRRPVVRAGDPLLLLALESVATGVIVDWAVDGWRLPHIDSRVPYSELDEARDVSFHLVGLSGVATSGPRAPRR